MAGNFTFEDPSRRETYITLSNLAERQASPNLNWMDVTQRDVGKWQSAPMGKGYEMKNRMIEDLGDYIKAIAASSSSAPNEAYGQIEFAGALMAYAGLDSKIAMQIAKGGALQRELGLKYDLGNGVRSTWDSFLYNYYNGKAGEAFSHYMMFPDNKDALALARSYEDKALAHKTAEKGNGWFADYVTKPMARVSGSSFEGSAGATTLMVGGKILTAATGQAWIMPLFKVLAGVYSGYKAGVSQGGMDFYQLYREFEAEGVELDVNDPTVRTLFMTDMFVQGLVEVGEFAWSPTYRLMCNILTPEAIAQQMGRTLRQNIRYFAGDFLKQDISESLEELVQGIASDTITNAVKDWSNKHNGTEFPLKDWKDIVWDASSAFAQSAVEMLPTVAMNIAIGGGIQGFRSAKVSKNQSFKFDPKAKQGVINNEYIKSNYKAKETDPQNETEEQKAKHKEKVDIINVVQTNNGAVPATKKDAENLAELRARNGDNQKFDVAINLVDTSGIAPETRASTLNLYGSLLNGDGRKLIAGYSEGKLIAVDDDAREEVKKGLQDFMDMQNPEGNVVVSPLLEDGSATKIEVVTEQEAEEQGIETKPIVDWSESGISREPSFRLSEEEFKQQAQAQDAFITLLSRTTGITEEEARDLFENDYDGIEAKLPSGITMGNLTSAAMYMPIMSEITGRTTEDLLSEGSITFEVIGRSKYVDRNTNSTLTLDEATGKVRGVDLKGNAVEYDMDDTKNVARAKAEAKTTNGLSTIRIYKDADAEDITHELMHVTRALASPERLAGFREAYGADDLWTDDIKDNGDGTYTFNGVTYGNRREAFEEARRNEERFVQDFFTYLRTNEAPNAQVKGFFDGLKKLLNALLDKLRGSLSDSTVRAFDRLLNGEVEVQSGQTVDEAIRQSEATLSDDIPFDEEGFLDYNDYSDEAEEAGLDAEGNSLWSLVDNETAERLDNEPTIKLYRSMQIKDGKLYAPMAMIINGKTEPIKMNTWYKSDENPDPNLLYLKIKGTKKFVRLSDMDPSLDYTLDKDTGELAYYFQLNKGNSKSLKARYNPYFHTTPSMLNDQFDSAHDRPELVVVEVEIPASEMTSGYKAKYAKDPVGMTEWKAGDVSAKLGKASGNTRKLVLSRYCKVVRVLEPSQVAQGIKDVLGDTGISIPDNTVTPQVRAELEKLGVPISKSGKVKETSLYSLSENKQWQTMDANTQRRIEADYERVYNEYYGTDNWMKAPNGKPTNLSERQWVMVRTPAFKEWFGDWINDPENASKVVDENGEPLVVYHGGLFGNEELVFKGQEFHFGTLPAAVQRATGMRYDVEETEGKYRWRYYGDEAATEITEVNGKTFNTKEEAYADAFRDYTSHEVGKFYQDSKENVGAFFLNIRNMAETEKDDPYWRDFADDVDGIAYRNTTEDEGSISYKVKNPAQIKSATDNVGTFDNGNDSILYSLAYHGSSEFFDKFLAEKIGSGEGAQTFGFGFYFSESDIIGKDYASRVTLDKNTYNIWTETPAHRRNLYKVEIPDNTGDNYFDFERLTVEHEKVVSLFDKAQESMTAEERQRFRDSRDYSNIYDTLWGFSPDAVFSMLSSALGGSRQASDFLSDMGYVGIVYKAGTMMGLPDGVKEGTRNYVIFPKNVGDIKILKHWEYDTDEEALALYSLTPTEEETVNRYLRTLPEAEQERINGNLERFNGTPWYYQAMKAALVRRDMQILMDGGEISKDSFLYKGTESVIEALRKGPEGVFQYVSEHSLIANSEKALLAVNGSLLDCNPTAGCAKFCYVTKGRMPIPTNIIKAEIVALAIRLDPIKSAKMAALQYKLQAGYDTKMVMRMFDRGDFSEEYVPFIKELNRNDVYVQIFTKRPEFLKDIDMKRNVVMMSIDNSNLDMLEKYPDLPVAVVYGGSQDVAIIESMKDRFFKHGGVILPVEIGRDPLPKEEIMALPQWARTKYTCPINSGTKTIGNWNCRKCDINGINGCFFGRSVKDRDKVGKPITQMSLEEINDIIGSIDNRDEAPKELIERGIGLGDPRFGRVLEFLSELRDRELGRTDGGATAQTGAESSSGPQRESGVPSEGGLFSLTVEDHNDQMKAVYGDSELYSLDGVLYAKTDPSFDYSDENLRRIQNEVRDQLKLFDDTKYSPQPELQFDDPSLGVAGGEPARVLRQGLSRYFSFEEGWNGQEPPIPSIDNQWTNLGYIDFTNIAVKDASDIAKLWSIYRNPETEYFHIIFTKGDTIVGSLALSSGVVGRSYARLAENNVVAQARMNERMLMYGADGYWLLHNHPSGDPTPSPQDRNLTQWYKHFVSGFKGHIVIDHNKGVVLTGLTDDVEFQAEGFHEIEREDTSKAKWFEHPNPVSVMNVYNGMRSAGTAIMYMRYYGERGYVVPESMVPYNLDYLDNFRILTNKEAGKSFWAVLVTDDYDTYDRLSMLASKDTSHAVDDVILVGDVFYQSAFEEGLISPVKDAFGRTLVLQDKVVAVKHQLEGKNVFDPKIQTGDTTLFSLSPEKQSEYLKRRENDIRNAVERGIFVRTEYLEEFRDREWAQEELAIRDLLKEDPSLLGLAKKSETLEAFKAALEEKQPEDVKFDGGERDEVWYERIFGYAHAQSSEEKDRQFAMEWTSTEDKTLELARTLANYKGVAYKPRPNSKRGGYHYVKNVYGAFQGVSTKLLRLQDGKSRRHRERSSSEDIREAQELIIKNPHAYRLAYNKVQKSEVTAFNVEAGLEHGLFDDMAWMEMEQIDDDIATDLERMENEQEAKREAGKRPEVDYRTKANVLERKLSDAERDLEAANVKASETIENLTRQLSEAKAKAKGIEKEISDAEKEVDKLIERMGRLVENEHDKLEERRARVKDLRSQLTEANRDVRRLEKANDALVRYIEAKKATEYRLKRISQIKRLATFNENSMDASYEDSMNWILNLFLTDEDRLEATRRIVEVNRAIEARELAGEDTDGLREELNALRRRRDTDVYMEPPAQVALYLPEGKSVRADNRQSMWSAEELDLLYRAVAQMHEDATSMLQNKKEERRQRLLKLSYDYFRQSTGTDAGLNDKGRMTAGALEETILSTQPPKEFGKVKGAWLSWHLYKAKIQRLARLIDGDREGVAYDILVRQNFQHQDQELRETNKRLALGQEMWKSLKLKDGDLVKEGYVYTKGNGQRVRLSIGEMIGVYVYSRAELGYEKLVDIRGNEIPKTEIQSIIMALDKKYIAWGNFLIWEMNRNYPRLKDTYYNVWNRNLGQRDNYFPLVSAEGHAMEQENCDFLTAENSSRDTKMGRATVNRSFTKEVNPNAIYPVNLNVTATWNKMVRRQEHFIAYGEWSRDVELLLGRYQMGNEIRRAYGEPYYRNVQKIVDYVISNNITTGTDFDRQFAKYFSARNSAALCASLSTMFKQLGSIGAIAENQGDFLKLFAGENYFRNFLKANAELGMEFGDVGNVKEFIYANAPDVKNRQVDYDVLAYLNRVYGGAFSQGVQKFTGTIMKYTTNLADRMVVERLWLARYYTEFESQKEHGKTTAQAHKEAVFKASQLISETQPTSMRMDQSGLQIDAQRSALLRMISAFTNQALNITNMVTMDMPLAIRQRNWRKVAGVATAVAVNVGLVALISGRFVRKGDEDDEDYSRRIIRELLATIAQTVDPIFGGNFAQGLIYTFSGSNSYLNEFTELGGVLRSLFSESKDKNLMEKLGDAFEKLAAEAAQALGIPYKNLIDRPIQVIKEKNPAYLLNYTWGEIWNSYR